MSVKTTIDLRGVVQESTIGTSRLDILVPIYDRNGEEIVGGGAVSGSGVPGGTNGQIQYRVSPGVFGGVSDLTYLGGSLFATGSFKGDVDGNAATATTASVSLGLTDGLKFASTLTYDPVSTPTVTTFNNWDDLWDAYLQTSGAVDIVLHYGIVATTTYVTYSFRNNTRVRGAFGAAPLLTIPEGTCFEDLREVELVKIQSTKNLSPALRFTDSYPHLFLKRDSALQCDGSAPMILWSAPEGSGNLSVLLDENSFLTSSGGAVIFNSGSGFDSQVYITAGQNCVIHEDTLQGNPGSKITFQATDGTADLQALQPRLSGTINGNATPISQDSTYDLVFDKTTLSVTNLHADTLRIFSPTSAGVPAGVFQGFSVTTTDATPVAFPTLAIPPVISAFVDSYFVARDTGSSDTAAWKLRGMIVGDGSGAFSGSLGIATDFHDYTAGGVTWNVSSSFNIPAAGDVKFYAVGEVGKTINWSLYQTVGIVPGF